MSRRQIVEAAAELVRREGLAAMSMRRLGRELGVDPMVPYRLFASRETLLDAVYDHVAQAAEPARSDDPIADVMRAFANFWHDLREHPGLLPLMTPRMLATRAAMGPFEWVLDRLTAAGLALDEALTAYATLLSFVLGSAAIHPDVQGRDDRVDPAVLPAERYPNLHRLAGPLDHAQLFAAGLEQLERSIREQLPR